MHKVKLIVSIVSLVGLTSGCMTYTQVQTEDSGGRKVGERRQYSTNYQLGVARTSNVGEAMVKFQDYWLSDIEQPTATPDVNIDFRYGLGHHYYTAGTKYRVNGRTNYEGVDYSVIPSPSMPLVSVLVRDDGSVDGTTLLEGRAIAPMTAAVTPPNARFKRETTTSVQTVKGYENFEILYTGANATGINLTYREFSPEGMARVAFFQNLSYPINAQFITFKKFRISVDRATAENITFTVIEDGQPKK